MRVVKNRKWLIRGNVFASPEEYSVYWKGCMPKRTNQVVRYSKEKLLIRTSATWRYREKSTTTLFDVLIPEQKSVDTFFQINQIVFEKSPSNFRMEMLIAWGWSSRSAIRMNEHASTHLGLFQSRSWIILSAVFPIQVMVSIAVSFRGNRLSNIDCKYLLKT